MGRAAAALTSHAPPCPPHPTTHQGPAPSEGSGWSTTPAPLAAGPGAAGWRCSWQAGQAGAQYPTWKVRGLHCRAAGCKSGQAGHLPDLRHLSAVNPAGHPPRSASTAGHPDDDYLPSPTAVLACRQLGFPTTRPDWKFAGVSADRTYFDVTTPPLAVQRVACTGSERSLSECAITLSRPEDPCTRPQADLQQCVYTSLTCSGE